MQKIIEELNRKIILESSHEMTKEQEYYVAGLSDTLEIIQQNIEDNYIIGHTYYVLMPNGKYDTKIEKMRLYRINKKKRWSYCFTKYLIGDVVSPDLVLSSKTSLNLRIYKNREDAERNRNNNFWRRNR